MEHRLNAILSPVKPESEVTLLDTCFTMPVIDALCDEGFKQAPRLPGGQDLVGAIGLRLAEMVVEDLAELGPGSSPSRASWGRTCSTARPRRETAGCRSRRSPPPPLRL